MNAWVGGLSVGLFRQDIGSRYAFTLFPPTLLIDLGVVDGLLWSIANAQLPC